MIVTLDIEGVPWKALNSSNAQATVYPIKVLVGNSAGYAEEKIAYLYDASTSKWTKLDGSSTYQDIDNYTEYCVEHEDVYINSKADAAIRNIKSVHDRCIRGELKFL